MDKSDNGSLKLPGIYVFALANFNSGSSGLDILGTNHHFRTCDKGQQVLNKSLF